MKRIYARLQLLLLVAIGFGCFNAARAADFYWIGGSGNWNDLSHWATASGGSVNPPLVPSAIDRVLFDNNSFAGPGTVTFNVAAFALDVQMSGLPAGVNFNLGAQAFTISGNVVFQNNITWTQTTGAVVLVGLGAKTINFAGINLALLRFNCPSGTYTATGPIRATNIDYVTGGFVLNGQTWNVGTFDARTSGTTNTRNINLVGIDTLYNTGSFILSANAATTYTMGTSVLKLTETGGVTIDVFGGGKVWGGDVVYKGSSTGSTIFRFQEGGTFQNIKMTSVGTTTFQLLGTPYNVLGDVTLNYNRISQAGNSLPSITFTPSASTFKNINIIGNGNMNPAILFNGGTTTFQDLNISGFGASFQSTLNVTGAGNTFRDVAITGTGASDLTSISVQGNTTFRDFTVTNVKPLTNWTITSNNTWRNWTIHPGSVVSIEPSRTQTVTNLIPVGTCANRIILQSRFSGQLTTITQAAGTVNGDYLFLADITRTGAAVYNANNSVNLGNVTGWNIAALASQDLYWVGGSGVWSDINHWRTSSGGAVLPCRIPTLNDNVFFDNNSFTAAGQSVSLDVPVAYCKNMTWTNGVTGGPSFNLAARILEINGSLDFDVAHTLTGTTNSTMIFRGRTAGLTIDPAGKSFEHVWIQGSGGVYALTSGLTALQQFQMNAGTFQSAGQPFTVRFLYGRNSSYTTYNIDFTGNSLITVGQELQFFTNLSAVVNMGTANILMNTNVNTTRNIFWGGKVYNDVTMTWTGFTTFAINLTDNFNGRDLTINRDGTGIIDFIGTYNCRDVAITYTASTAGTPACLVRNIGTYRNYTLRTTGVCQPSFAFQQNNNFTGTFDAGPGMTLIFYSTRVQTAAQYVLAGACDRSLRITNEGAVNPGTISQATGTVSGNYLVLDHSRAQGGAVFNATNTIDNGSNVGWNIIPLVPKNLFWVGGTGNWSDANHWALASGGPGNGCFIPTSIDNVFFDANSFTANGQTVTLNQSGTCNNYTWSGTTFTGSFLRGNNNLDVRGSLVLNNAMTFNNGGTGNMDVWGSVTILSPVTWVAGNYLQLRSPNPGNTILIQPAISHIRFLGAGTHTLQAHLTATTEFRHEFGTFVSGGFRVTTATMSDAFGNVRSMNFTGTDTVYVSTLWNHLSSNAGLTMGGAVIKFNPGVNSINPNFIGGNRVYNDIVVDHRRTLANTVTFSGNNTVGNVKMFLYGPHTVNVNGNSTYNDMLISYRYASAPVGPVATIVGSNVFNDFTATNTNQNSPTIVISSNNTYNNMSFGGVGMVIQLGAGRIQTVNQFSAVGTGSYPIYLQSSVPGLQSTLMQATNQVCLNYLNVKDINAQGGATFFAGYTSNDLGNNTNWIFQSCLAYYWVGGTGNWSDLTHWRTTSGGAIQHVVLPTQYDDVFFDLNSFTGNNETVNINIANPRCRNMSWVTSLFNPDVIGSGTDMNIFGSLTMVPNMTVSWNGNWNFKGTTGNYTINTAGVPVTTVNLVGPGGASPAGTWTLQNTLNATNVHHDAGTFNLNNRDVNAKFFRVRTSATRNLNLTNSLITLTDGGWDLQNRTNLIFNSGNSRIVINGNSSSNFFGNDLSYYDLKFTTSNFLASTLTGQNVFHDFQVDPGLTLSMEASKTQTITNLIANGTCPKSLTIQSTVPGTPANFFQASGSANADFINLRDNSGTGGATYTATRSNDLGGNTNWAFTPFPNPTVAVTTTPVTCGIPNNGTALATVTNGDAPYAYLWSNSATTQLITQLVQGTYTVTVTDGNGCLTSGSGIVNTIGAPDASFSYTPTNCAHPGTNISFTASTPSGVTYAWTFGDGGTSSAANPVHSYALPGSYIVQLTVTDMVGCVQSSQQTLNACNQAPVAVCQNLSFNAGASCSAMATAAQFNGGSSDPDGDAISFSVSPTAPYSLGTTTVTLTVTDVFGATSACTATVTVIDVTAPTISCPAAVNVSNGVGVCGAAMSYNTPVGDDNCSGETTVQTSGMASGSTFPVGTTTNTFVVTDGAGLSATCSFTVTVTDTEAPAVACQAIQVSPTAGNPVTVTPAQVTVSATDNCGVSSSTLSPNVFSCSQAGLTLTATLTVTDVNGNTSQCFPDIEVLGNACNTAPVAVCQNITVNANANCEGMANASQFDGGSTDVNNDPLSFTVAPAGPYALGTTAVVLTVSDGQASSTCTASITVEDHTPPTITCPASLNVSSGAGVCSAVVNFQVGGNGSLIYGTDAQGFLIQRFDANTLAHLGSIPMVVPGLPNGQNFGMSRNPITGVVYAVAGSTTVRNLITLNPLTGNGVLIGPTGLQISSIAFDGNGVLYAVTGAAGATAGKLYSLNLTTGASTFVMNVPPDGGNGLAFNSTDGLLYRLRCGGFEKINVQTQTVTAIPVTGYNPGCVYSMMYEGSGTFLVNDQTNNNWSRISSTGNGTLLASSAIHVKGLQAITLPSVSASDNCTVTLVQNCGLPSGSAFPVGTTTNCFLATDGAGNTATCTFSVTVTDNVAPTAICRNLTVNLNGSGTASITASQVNNGSSDNCGISSVSVSASTFGCTNVGANTVVLTVTDASGNTATCNSLITVQDNIAPAIVCPANISMNNSPGTCGAAVSFAATATDNCAGATVAYSTASGSTFAVGTASVTATATDASGNTASCFFNVTVSDVEAPVVVCPANISVNDDDGACAANVTYAATFSDNCPGATVAYSPASGSSFPIGVSSVSVSVVDAHGNTAACSFSVTVHDTDPPTIVCPANMVVPGSSGAAPCTGPATFADATSSDNCSVATVLQTAGLPSGSNFPNGVNTVTFTATDGSGNTASCSFTATVGTCNLAPTAVCQDITVNADANCEGNATASQIDNGSSDPNGDPLTFSLSPTGPYALGTTTVTLTVSDGALSSTCTSTVAVEDHTPPTITCPASLSVSNSVGACSAVVSYSATASDNCPGTSVSYSPASGSSFALGTTTVTATATDGSGNTSTCGFTVTVLDTEAPTTFCYAQGNFVVSPTQTFAVEVGYQNLGGYSDNCGPVTGTVSQSTFSCALAGQVIPVVVTVSDPSGNTATCTVNVEVSGANCNQGPTAVCQNITVNADANCEGNAAASQFDGGSSDPNGDPLTFSVSPAGPYALGNTSVVLTVSDGSLSSICTATITVEDHTAPTILCPANITVPQDTNGCGAVVTFANASATDNCGSVTVAQTAGLSFGSTFPTGTSTVTFTATDGAGNTASCSFTVSVSGVTIQPGSFALVGDANATGNDCFQLTPAANNRFGAVWYQNLLTLSSDFSLEFDINLGSNDANGADGMAFVLQPVSTGQGSNGGGLGYQGIAPSLDVEFDTWQNTNNSDPAADHIGINQNGNVSHATGALVAPVAMPNMEDGQYHRVKIDWDANSTHLSVYYDNVLRTSLTQNITSTVFNGNANVYWGWTAATGGSVNDQRLCMVNLSFTESLMLSTNAVSAPCGGGSIDLSVSGGNAPYAYVWSNGATTQDISGLAAGTYCVTVTDQCGQSAVICDTVQAGIDVTPPVIVCPGNIVVVNCNGVATYSATATDNCQLAGIAYSPASGSVFPQGTTTVTATATDAAGNTASCTFTVTVTTPALSVSVASPVDGCGYNVSSCCNTGNEGSGSGSGHGSGGGHGSGSGSGDHNGSGGSGSDQGHDGSDGSGSGTGQHGSHCTDRTCPNYGHSIHGGGHGHIGQSGSLGHHGQHGGHGSGTLGGHGHGHGHDGSGSGNLPPCGHDGQATATATGGCAPYTYHWSTGATTATITGLTPGLYIVTVTDANGATVVQNIVLTQASLLSATATATPGTCYGANNGSATAHGAGGCAPYTYHWSTGATTATIGGLRPGSYCVTITDGYGCQARACVTVGQPSRLIADAGANQVVVPSYAPQACATLLGTVSGGTAPYGAVWRTGNGVVIGTGLSISVCPTATMVYYFFVTDANGCTARDSVVVCARNISCGNNMIQICHNAPGHYGHMNTLCVSTNAVPAHLQHGDQLGACGSVTNCAFPGNQGHHGSGHGNHHKSEEAAGANEGPQPELSMRAFPNPTNGDVMVELACRNCIEEGVYTLKVTDIYGQEILLTDVPVTEGEGGIKLDLSKYSAGVYLITVMDGDRRLVERIVRQ